MIIPTYNERNNIPKLVSQILNLERVHTLLVVDDNSPDGTGQVVDHLSRSYPQVQVIHRPGKLGLGTAYKAGFRYTLSHDYDTIVTMDADFSHSPEYLPRFFSYIEKYDLVIGSRYISGGTIVNWRLIRKIMSKSANIVATNLLGFQLKDCTSGYRCYRRALLEAVDFESIKSDGYSFLVEILYKCYQGGANVKEFPIIFKDRYNGKSKISRKEIFKGMLTILRLKFQDD